MSQKSAIEWTQATWNPVRGCSIVSPGCKRCYAMRDAARKNANPKLPDYKGFAIFNDRHQPHWTGKVELIPHMLDMPLKRKKPTTYFVNSMSDLFHESLPDEAIDRVFAVMALCPQHTFQVLTKRAQRMREWVSGVNSGERFHDINVCAQELAHSPGYSAVLPTQRDGMVPGGWPLPNVWLGVSVEDRKRKDRIKVLRQTPAAVRFLSLEPLLEDLGELDLRGIHWVIVGGESGPGARPLDVAWVRSIVAQCKAASVACFVKQLGAKPFVRNRTDYPDWPRGTVFAIMSMSEPQIYPRQLVRLKDRKGGAISEWPEDLRVREMPLSSSSKPPRNKTAERSQGGQ